MNEQNKEAGMPSDESLVKEAQEYAKFAYAQAPKQSKEDAEYIQAVAANCFIEGAKRFYPPPKSESGVEEAINKLADKWIVAYENKEQELDFKQEFKEEISRLLSASPKAKYSEEDKKCSKCKFWEVVIVRESYGRYGFCNNKIATSLIIAPKPGEIEYGQIGAMMMNKNFGCNQFSKRPKSSNTQESKTDNQQHGQ